MKQESKFATAIARPFLLACLAGLAISCSGTHPVEHQISLHPVHETRMSEKPLPGYVATGAWRVRGPAGNSVYFVGTCHVTPEREIPFPSTYYAAYQDSPEVFFEIDDDSFATSFMILAAVPGVIRFYTGHSAELHNPEGRKLSDQLSPQTIKLLRRHYGSSFSEKEDSSPLGLIVEHQLMGDAGPDKSGVDDVFYFLAKRDRKKVRALDGMSVTGAIQPVLELTLEEARKEIAKKGPDAAVRESILAEDEEDSDWRYGKFGTSTRKTLADMKKNHPATYQDLLPRRNQQWMAPIKRAIAGKRNAAFFVGALHLQGPDGLVELLRREGYHPQQLYGVDRPKVTRPLRR